MKSHTKSEIAQAAGMSVNTLRRWMKRNEHKFAHLDLDPTQRLLHPKAVRFICEELGISEADFEW